MNKNMNDVVYRNAGGQFGIDLIKLINLKEITKIVIEKDKDEYFKDRDYGICHVYVANGEKITIGDFSKCEVNFDCVRDLLGLFSELKIKNQIENQ